ncbi:helix-turn-helix transcriptional regulator [Microbacterium sp. RURRCA19A]|uniref:helix-turn-helix transcriptional regulator n=1 Tax=Microbacterium sp. RURRCA19A TaxID=1907391 RepID=UPI0009572AF1|nr:helix-turn-helix transcriptional regulator [Microbacterium sp. RURRCA19A]SIS17763.1 DNA-binding transcriptional regulator, XRE-family HTH domain [Microbacterium sp. RURRCA19A]
MAKRRPEGAWAAYARTVGTNIHRARLERGLSQEQVAYAAGLSRYTFQKFEKGESMPDTPANPSLRNIMAIAQVLGMTLDDLAPQPWPDLSAGRAE